MSTRPMRDGARRAAGAAAAAVLATLLAAACGGDDGGGITGPPPVPGIRTVAGAGVDDTVHAQPLQALVVEVRGEGGRPAAGVVVRFEGTLPADSTRRAERGVLVCALTTPQCGPAQQPFAPYDAGTFATARTDSTGRAAVIVRLGTVAGPAWLAIAVPELGLRDSTSFTVRPGAPVRVRVDVRDTAVAVGGTYRLGAAVRDRFGNPRADAIALTPGGPEVEVSPAGVVTGRAAGRSLVVARAGTLADTGRVSVVPAGRIVAYEVFGQQRHAIVAIDLDRSRRVNLSTEFGSSYGGWPAWSPDGARVAFHAGYDFVRLYVVSADASRRALLPTWATQQFHPRWSPDGQWIYFTNGSVFGGGRIARVRADGTVGEELRSVPGDQPVQGTMPDVSPDGARVIYTSATPGDAWSIEVFDLARRTVTRLPIRGQSPRWSPDGATIAYLDESERLATARADGSGARPVTITGMRVYPAFDWSPDGQWLVVRAEGGGQPEGIHLVRASDGNLISLVGTMGWFQPSWRRVGP